MRHKLFDQAVNSLCIVSPIFVKPQRKKAKEARGCKKRENLLPPRSRAPQPERELYVPHVDACMCLLSLKQPIIFLGAWHRLLTSAAHFFCSVHTFAAACGFAGERLPWQAPHIQNNCHHAKKLPLFRGILSSCTGLECASWSWGSLSSYHPAQCMALGLFFKKNYSA